MNSSMKLTNRKSEKLEEQYQISSMQSMIVGQEKERQRIAVDLHDSARLAGRR